MDPRRLVLHFLATTLLLAALAGAAYTGLREVSAEADAVGDRMREVVLLDPLLEDMGSPPAAAAAARVREATAGGPREAEGLRASALVEAALAAPGDPAALARAREAVRALRRDALEEARRALRDRADRPAAARARWILYGSSAAAILGSLAFSALLLRALRERRAAGERVRRAEALAALGTLAAGVAHEVNNPLATIAACADAALARLRADPPDPARAGDLLRTAGAEARRCAGIVREITDAARDGAPAAGPVDLPALVRETVGLAGLHPRLGRVPVALSRVEEVPVLLADAGRVQQALLNLLSNAAEASPEGGRVDVEVLRDGAGAAVTVRDRGPGVPPEERGRIFEPFRSGKPGGTGLGLAIVERVASSHGGTVEVEDAPGGGALFRLRLPARPSKQ
jgi:signal transduction histidine kinase